jgi:hypothetical protein
MARVAKSSKTTKPAAKGRGTGRPTATAAKTAAKAKHPKVTKVVAAKRAPIAAAPAQKLSKDELRAQVEKLERGNATLRAKSREANRTAKTTAARVAELEEQVARLEKQLTAQANDAAGGGGGRSAPASKPALPSKSGRRPKRREINPGDALPPGVAVEEPALPDPEAETARENLEEKLGKQESENETI